MKKYIVPITLLVFCCNDSFSADAITGQLPPSSAPKAVATLDCNYKIPASTKHVESNLVSQWAVKAVQQAFDLDFDTMDAQLQQLKNCFTEQGWQGFSEALEKSGNLKAIKEQKLVMTNKLEGEPRFIEEKESQWKITIPLEVLYQSAREKMPQSLSVDLLIGRKLSGDLGILQMIASPRPVGSK